MPKQRKGGQELLQVHVLPWDELGHRDPDDLDAVVEVVDDAPHLLTAEDVTRGALGEMRRVARPGGWWW